jgi:hypothetical protein
MLSLFNLFIQKATIYFHLQIRSLLRNSQKFSFASQPSSRKKEKINERLQSLCQGQRNLHVHEIRTSSSERDGGWKKKMGEKNEKSVLIM